MTRNDSRFGLLLDPPLLLGALLSELVVPRPCPPIVLTCCYLLCFVLSFCLNRFLYLLLGGCSLATAPLLAVTPGAECDCFAAA